MLIKLSSFFSVCEYVGDFYKKKKKITLEISFMYFILKFVIQCGIMSGWSN